MGTDVPNQQIPIERRSPAYWKVLLENPPFNIFGPDTIPQLNEVIIALETDSEVKVVVFGSTVPAFFLTHYDFPRELEKSTSLTPGPTGMHRLLDMLVRLTRAPVVSISSIRGRATGGGSDRALASDMRFASREKSIPSQWEIGVSLVSGGGPTSRLPRVMGRGRVLEVLLSGGDIDDDLAERYGYVNRSFADAELAGFVDALALRIASFDRQAIVNIKRLVNVASLPNDSEVNAEWDAFIASVQRPKAQQKIKRLMEMGLERSPDIARSVGNRGDAVL